MNPIPNPALGRRIRRAAWQCLLLVLVGLALSSIARAQVAEGPAMQIPAAGPGQPDHSPDRRIRTCGTA